MNSIGVIIARFQTPYLHAGHKTVLDSVRAKHNKTVIVLGISPVRGSRKNPLDFHTRETMIKKDYPDVVVLPLPDHPLDAKWSQSLDSLLANTFPGLGFKLYGGRDSFIQYYNGKNETIELPDHGAHSATIIRKQISDKVLDSVEFRTGIVYAYSNMYAKVYPTVDIAVFRNNKTEILLGLKSIDNKWRLLGGFADPTDNDYESAAKRELSEECGLIVITEMTYEKSHRVNDWRYRNDTDKIITCLFSTDFLSGEPKGNDDIQEVKWFPLPQLAEMIAEKATAEEHEPQLLHLWRKYK
jgi:bifunctional NMN adenylyltransferase/nudix hydrolase